MICLHCQKQNKEESKFCRFCGKNLSEQPSHLNTTKEDSHFQIRIPKNLLKKISPKVALVILLVFALIGTTVYAAPKVNDFVKVRTAIQQAKEKQNLGEYQTAIDILNQVENRWSLKSQKQELIALKESQGKFIGYEQIIASSTEKEKTGNLKEARTLLQQIGADYPKFESNIQPKLSELQKNIEKNLEEKVNVANTAKKAAEKRAAEEVVAKIQAEAESRAATDAKARADANAAAAAQTARDAEQQAAIQRAAAEQAAIKAAEQAAIQRVEEVRKSFRNQLYTAKTDLTTANGYFNDAMSYFNSGNDSVALVGFAKANALYGQVQNTAKNINNTFTGMPQSYTDAANNLALAANYSIKATNSVIDSMSGDSTAAITNSNSDLADMYQRLVANFLNSF